MSKPDPDPKLISLISGTDVINEIRRHLRKLDLISSKGDGESVFEGREAKISDVDPSVLQSELSKAMSEMAALAELLEQRKNKK